ncbi:hypothetical protein RHECNPAF_1260037 [Rhizobium etli CNPAF512]|nr:hypothetical protein RHECNPAF_1260037 [Rhizobium etli CNPAF512]
METFGMLSTIPFESDEGLQASAKTTADCIRQDDRQHCAEEPPRQADDLFYSI